MILTGGKRDALWKSNREWCYRAFPSIWKYSKDTLEVGEKKQKSYANQITKVVITYTGWEYVGDSSGIVTWFC